MKSFRIRFISYMSALWRGWVQHKKISQSYDKGVHDMSSLQTKYNYSSTSYN